MTAAPTDMQSSAPAPEPARPAIGRVGIVLWGAAALCVVAAGLVLWHARGAGVFTDVLAAAIAWCF